MYYDDEVIMRENEMEPTVGKEANRKREQQFFAGITAFRGAKVIDIAVDENVSFVK